MSFLDALRVRPGPVDLSDYETRATPEYDGDKKAAVKDLAKLGDGLADLQERLYANGTAGDHRRILLVLQGMDTAGKGGTIRKAVGLVDPQGVRISSFKSPTKEELAHDFLWRIKKEAPVPGYIRVFDRSHYEDVLIGRVRQLADPDEIERRYGAINEFEKELTDDGVTIIKCFLHINAETQRERLAARLDDPEKYWKYNPGDIDERQWWPDYQRAYEIALERTSTEYAPWYVVPSGRKWYRNLAVATMLHETLTAMDLTWPEADVDVEAEKKRLAADTISGTGT